MEISRLEMIPSEMHAIVQKIMDHLAPLHDGQFYTPSAQIESATTFAKNMFETLPEEGEHFETLIDHLFTQILPNNINEQHPSYMAYFPGGGLFQGALGDWISAAVNRHVGTAAVAPALVGLECNVIRWLAQIMGYPENSIGYLSSGGSMANFSAVVTARNHFLQNQIQKGVLYFSDQTHSSLKKAALLAGFSHHQIKEIQTDSHFKMIISDLEKEIQKDRLEGRIPFFVSGNAGTTSTGTVDDLNALADICSRENMWFHVDAAYGGLFRMTELGKKVLSGIELSDSVTIDPHKTLFLPFGTGALLVKNADALHAAHRVDSPYLPPEQLGQDLWDFWQISPELSRQCRGLKIWLPLKMHGISTFRNYLQEKLDLAHWFCEKLESAGQIDVVCKPQLSTFAFKLLCKDKPQEEQNIINKEFLEKINHKENVRLSGTTVHGQFVIRVCVLSFRTHKQELEKALVDILAARDEMKAT